MDGTAKKRLLAWYRKTPRIRMPWRESRDPYAIWISEAMLQQTQVETVIPYYNRFLKRFPTVKALAQAPLTEVLESWSGLGYYSRAKNLHAAAQQIVKEHAGKLPNSVESLMKLPGIGRYTAGAIVSIAFSIPAPILDGNVIRVISRLNGIRKPSTVPAVQKKLWKLAEEALPPDNPGDFNQALMDLGATLCSPRDPQCPVCPIKRDCVAYKQDLQEKIPPPKQAIQRKKIQYLCGILEKNGSVLVARRPTTGLLPGLWEFPGGEPLDQESEHEALVRLLSERLGVTVQPGERRAKIRQLLTHRELHIQAYGCRWKKSGVRPRWYTATRWVSKKNLQEAALTAGNAKLAKQLFEVNS